MQKTIIDMILTSRFRLPYLLILLIPTLYMISLILLSPYNFSILLLVNFIATFSSLIMTLELLIQEEGTKVYNYLITIRSENYVMIYRSISIFIISGTMTVITSLVLNITFLKDIYIVQQLIYLVLILFGNFFYIYLLQYLAINLNNMLVRNTIIISVTGISMLALMTKSLSTYIMLVTMLGLFLAVTFMNKRLTDEIKRTDEHSEY